MASFYAPPLPLTHSNFHLSFLHLHLRVSSLTHSIFHYPNQHHSNFLLPKWTLIPRFLPISQTLHATIILDLICMWVGMRILMGVMILGWNSSVFSGQGLRRCWPLLPH